jgi:hypothetical protein
VQRSVSRWDHLSAWWLLHHHLPGPVTAGELLWGELRRTDVRGGRELWIL